MHFKGNMGHFGAGETKLYLVCCCSLSLSLMRQGHDCKRWWHQSRNDTWVPNVLFVLTLQSSWLRLQQTLERTRSSKWRPTHFSLYSSSQTLYRVFKHQHLSPELEYGQRHRFKLRTERLYSLSSSDFRLHSQQILPCGENSAFLYHFQ